MSDKIASNIYIDGRFMAEVLSDHVPAIGDTITYPLEEMLHRHVTVVRRHWTIHRGIDVRDLSFSVMVVCETRKKGGSHEVD